MFKRRPFDRQPCTMEVIDTSHERGHLKMIYGTVTTIAPRGVAAKGLYAARMILADISEHFVRGAAFAAGVVAFLSIVKWG